MSDLDTPASPSDVVIERLNDPEVAAALLTLLDNAELLSTLVVGLSGLMERGDYIMDTVAESLREFKDASEAADLPSAAELRTVATELQAGLPAVQRLLNSPIVEPRTIDTFSQLSEALTEGVAVAKADGTKVTGIRSFFTALRDADVQRGLGATIEIARSLGRRMA